MKSAIEYWIGWLQTKQGVNLVSDDYGRWAVSDCGTQPIPEEQPTSMAIVSFVEADDWQPTVQEAFEYYFKKNEVKV